MLEDPEPRWWFGGTWGPAWERLALDDPETHLATPHAHAGNLFHDISTCLPKNIEVSQNTHREDVSTARP